MYVEGDQLILRFREETPDGRTVWGTVWLDMVEDFDYSSENPDETKGSVFLTVIEAFPDPESDSEYEFEEYELAALLIKAYPERKEVLGSEPAKAADPEKPSPRKGRLARILEMKESK